MKFALAEYETVDIWINNAGVNQPQKSNMGANRKWNKHNYRCWLKGNCLWFKSCNGRNE